MVEVTVAQSLVLSSKWNSLMHGKSNLEIGFYVVKNNIIQYRNRKRNRPVQTSYTLEMDTVFLKVTLKKIRLKNSNSCLYSKTVIQFG